MNITVLKETVPGEGRVALMPDSVKKLVALKATVMVESDAGIGAARLGVNAVRRVLRR